MCMSRACLSKVYEFNIAIKKLIRNILLYSYQKVQLQITLNLISSDCSVYPKHFLIIRTRNSWLYRIGTRLISCVCARARACSFI